MTRRLKAVGRVRPGHEEIFLPSSWVEFHPALSQWPASVYAGLRLAHIGDRIHLDHAPERRLGQRPFLGPNRRNRSL